MDEIWKPIPGYEGCYMISNHGRVLSLPRISASGAKLKGKIRKHSINSSGHHQVGLHRDGKKRLALVHVLVLEAFTGPRPYGMEACHNDGDHDNNRADNLRWGTHSENMRDRDLHGKGPKGTRKTHCKRGHEFNDKNAIIRSDGHQCRACAKGHDLKKYRPGESLDDLANFAYERIMNE